MRKLNENIYIFHFQKGIASVESVCGYTVCKIIIIIGKKFFSIKITVHQLVR